MHTRGPWDRGASKDTYGYRVWDVTAADGTFIAFDLPFDREDDARLIAAAPSLLSALIDAADELGSISQTAATDDVLAAARKAIELATGDAYAQR